MLETLGAVQWSKLSHAYGEADDVPAQLNALAGDDPEARAKALHKSYGNIFHQGSRYPVTPYVVPYLLEMIANPAVAGRADIVYLLVHLALGYPEQYLPNGVDAVELRRSCAGEIAAVSDEDGADESTPRIAINCYDAVLRGVPTFIDLLGESDIDVQRAAVFALAWFPEAAAETVSELRAALDRDTDTSSLANIALSIGLLGRQEAGVDVCVLEPLLRHELIGVRVAAAIACARDPLSPSLVDILIDGIVDCKTLVQQTDGLLFNEGDLTGYAGVTLSTFRADTADRAVPALCTALEAADPYQSLNITQAILSLVVDDQSPPLRNQPASTLSSLQRDAVLAICVYGGWKIRNGSFGNYSMLVRAFGLPYSQEDLLSYLDGA